MNTFSFFFVPVLTSDIESTRRTGDERFFCPPTFHCLQHHLQLCTGFMSVVYKDAGMNLSDNSAKSGYETLNAIMQEAPAMSFRCRDIGMDCSFEAHGSTAPELMRKFIDHAESAHTMQVLSADVILNVNKAIIRTRFNEGRE